MVQLKWGVITYDSSFCAVYSSFFLHFNDFFSEWTHLVIERVLTWSMSISVKTFMTLVLFLNTH